MDSEQRKRSPKALLAPSFLDPRKSHPSVFPLASSSRNGTPCSLHSRVAKFVKVVFDPPTPGHPSFDVKKGPAATEARAPFLSTPRCGRPSWTSCQRRPWFKFIRRTRSAKEFIGALEPCSPPQALVRANLEPSRRQHSPLCDHRLLVLAPGTVPRNSRDLPACSLTNPNFLRVSRRTMRFLSPISTLLPLFALLLVTPSSHAAIERGGSSLYTESVTYCSDAKAVLVNQFDIEYFVANQSVVFALSAASVEDNLNISANIFVNAYGMDLLNLTINLCDYLEGILCPLPTINFTGYGTYPLPSEYTSKIPSIAYSVPDLEAYAQIQLVSVDTGEVAACLQATLSNGWSTRTIAVAWASAALFLAALLVALVHSTLKASPSPAVYRWHDVLHLFQVAAATGLLNLNYPSVYANFTLNFSWALGLFHNDNIRQAVNHLRGLTGGKLSDTAYPGVDYVNRKLSPYNEAIRLINFNAVLPSGTTTRDMFKSFFAQTTYEPMTSSSSSDLARRASAEIPTVSSTNANSIVQAGIPTFLNALGIPTADGFDFIFLIYLMAIAVTLGFLALFFLTVFLLDLFRREERRGTGWVGRNRRGFMSFATGNFLRLCLVFLFPILIFSFYQWTVGRNDSWLSILLSVLCILWTTVPLIIAFVWTVIRGKQREYGEPYDISPLFSRFRLYHSVGMIYRQFKQKRHFWWFAPLALAYVAQAAFVGFAQHSAWAQVIGLLVIEFIVFVSYIVWRPHKDVKGDLLEIFLSFCRLAAFGLLIAFIPSVGVKAIIRTIIGFVIIVLFGIPTILLFFGLLFNLGGSSRCLLAGPRPRALTLPPLRSSLRLLVPPQQAPRGRRCRSSLIGLCR